MLDNVSTALLGSDQPSRCDVGRFGVLEQVSNRGQKELLFP